MSSEHVALSFQPLLGSMETQGSGYFKSTTLHILEAARKVRKKYLPGQRGFSEGRSLPYMPVPTCFESANFCILVVMLPLSYCTVYECRRCLTPLASMF
jgi:hypothetical protein